MTIFLAAFFLGSAVSTGATGNDGPQPAAPRTAPRQDDDDDAAKPAAPAAKPVADDDDLKPNARSATQAAARKPADDDDEGKAQPATAVVITAKKLDVARTQINPELGATVYSLGNDAIEDRPGGESSSMAVMLAQTPGVGFSGDALTIRGSKDIQVRINNVIVPEAVADPADHLSIRLAQSTSVMTGTLPAQYGFVPAGVISVTTKNGLYRHGGELEFYAGSYGFTEPAFEWAGSLAGNSLFVSGSRETGRTNIADLRGNEARDRSRDVEGLAFADRIVGANDRFSLVVGGSRSRQDIGATSLIAGNLEEGDSYIVGTFQHSTADLTVQTSLFFGGATNEACFNRYSRERRTTTGTQIDASYDAGVSNTLRAGLLAGSSRAHERQSHTQPVEAHRTAIGAYLQDEWKLSSELTFNPGIRVDWLDGFDSGGQIEPRASLVWSSPSGLTVHVGYARYAQIEPVDDVGDAAMSLPTEHDDYFDAGLQYRVGAFTLGADAYVRAVRNFLTERQTVGSALTDAFAFSDARFKGIELSATYSTHRLSAWANLSLSHARGRGLIDPSMLFSSATIQAADTWISLSSERPVTGSGGITWRPGKLAFSGTVTASSGALRSANQFSPNQSRARAHATFGLSAIYHAGLGGRLSDFRIDITNLANAHYAVNDASNLEGGWTQWARGRAITFGIEQGF